MKYKDKWIIMDLETAPLPMAIVESWCPDWVDWQESMFDVDSVRVGNLKDPVKIVAKRAEARDKAKREHLDKQESARSKIVDKAALHPNTGWIFGYGIALPTGEVVASLELDRDKEPETIRFLWNMLGNSWAWINHNMLGFDLPFLVARSLLHGIEVPFPLPKFPRYSGGTVTLHNHVNPITVIDTMMEAERFTKRSHPSLDWCGKFFNRGEKVDLGEDKLPWDVAREDLDFDKAILYTERDVELTRDIAAAMQLIPMDWEKGEIDG